MVVFWAVYEALFVHELWVSFASFVGASIIYSSPPIHDHPLDSCECGRLDAPPVLSPLGQIAEPATCIATSFDLTHYRYLTTHTHH